MPWNHWLPGMWAEPAGAKDACYCKRKRLVDLSQNVGVRVSSDFYLRSAL